MLLMQSRMGFNELLNDSDVDVYLLHYRHDFLQLRAAEIWIQYGTGHRKPFISLHELARSLGQRKSKVVLKDRLLSGCYVASKIGTKASALRHEPEKYLEHFGETESFPDDMFQLAEKYLIHLCKSGANSDTFSDLRAE